MWILVATCVVLGVVGFIYRVRQKQEREQAGDFGANEFDEEDL